MIFCIIAPETLRTHRLKFCV